MISVYKPHEPRKMQHIRTPQSPRSKTFYIMQDGRDFYCFDNPRMDGEPKEIHTSIIKVPDWDVEAAEAARDWFHIAICGPRNIFAIFPNPFR